MAAPTLTPPCHLLAIAVHVKQFTAFAGTRLFLSHNETTTRCGTEHLACAQSPHGTPNNTQPHAAGTETFSIGDNASTRWHAGMD